MSVCHNVNLCKSPIDKYLLERNNLIKSILCRTTFKLAYLQESEFLANHVFNAIVCEMNKQLMQINELLALISQ